VAKLFGFFMTIAGSALCGVLVLRLGILRPLLLGAILVAGTNLLFSPCWRCNRGEAPPDLFWLALVISADNLSGGIAEHGVYRLLVQPYASQLHGDAICAVQLDHDPAGQVYLGVFGLAGRHRGLCGIFHCVRRNGTARYRIGYCAYVAQPPGRQLPAITFQHRAAATTQNHPFIRK
jgi:hypothetical protein